jgi:hypothetical protein
MSKALVVRLKVPEVLKYYLVCPRDIELDVLCGKVNKTFLTKLIKDRHLNSL